MTNPTDTNQASEDMVDDFYSLPPTSRTKANLRDYIRTEKLKLLAEVRERVVEQAKPDKRKATSWQQGIEVAAYEDAVRVYEYKMNGQLTKLEAEL